MNKPIRVLIVDAHAIVREGLHALLGEEDEFEVVGEAARGTEALTLVPLLKPDVVLMDLAMPELDGIATIHRLRQTEPRCNILVLTSFGEDQRVRDAVQAGAIGYLLKDVLRAELLRAIRAAARGEPTLHPEAQRVLMRQASAPVSLIGALTERERDVLGLLAHGRSNKEIAAELRLTEGTIKGYVSTILDKLQVEDRTQAALYAVKHGMGETN